MLDVAKNISGHPNDPLDRDPVSSPVASNVVGLRDMVRLIRRRATFILCFVAACIALLCLALASMKSTYTATSMLVLERNETKVLEAVTQLDGKERGQGVDRDRAAVETEMDLITSRVFAGKVVDAMGLVNDPWFNPYLTRTGQKLPSAAVQRDASITSLLSSIWVTRGGESLVVSVHVRNPDPEWAAAIANNAADIYVEWSRELKLKSMTDAVKFLRERGRQVAQASNLGPQHPDVVKTEAEVASVDAMIEAEISRLVEETKNPEPAQTETGGGTQDAAKERGLAEMRLRDLQRSLLADRKLYDLVLGRADSRAEIASPGARVVSSAAVPTKPSFPQTQRILAAGAVGSLVLAILFALVLEAVDTRVRDSRRVEQLVQVPNLSEFPRTRPAAGEGRRWRAGAMGKSRGPFIGLGELLRRDLLFLTSPFSPSDANASRGKRMTALAKSSAAAISGPPQLLPGQVQAAARGLYFVCRSRISAAKPAVLFATPMPSNGTPTVALGFAIAAAQDGLSTAIVDLDPSGESNAALSATRRRSIEEVIANTCSLTQALQAVPNIPGLYYIESISTWEDDTAPIKSSSMHALLKQLRGSFDLIVIVSAPVLTRETANWLSPLVDATLLVAQAGTTTEQQLLDASATLRANRSPLIGTVLTGVDRPHDERRPALSRFGQRVRSRFSTAPPVGRPDAEPSA